MADSKIRSLLERNNTNRIIKQNFLQAFPFWVGSLFTGLVAVFYTKLFSLAEQSTTYLFHRFSWFIFFLCPACFVGAWWIVRRFAPYSRGSGIPQVMVAMELTGPDLEGRINRLLSFRIILVKILSSLIMVCGGGAIGREGPTIQISASIFRGINKALPVWWLKISKNNMIVAGAAAGLAAAFNTPLGGIVFAIEELTKTHINNFKTPLFTAIIIAGLTAQGLLGPYLYLGYPDVSHLTGSIFFFIIIVACITGLAGAGMSRLMLIIFRWKAGFRNFYQHLIYLTIGALLIALLAYFVSEQTFGSGKELITQVLFTHQKHLSWYLPLVRMAGPVLSFTSGAAGGIFAPSLSAGASIGSLLAGWFHLSEPDTNLLILSGMVGFLTGVTRTPFTSAILVLEMTDRHNVIFHLMLAGIVSGIAAMLIDKHSFYDRLKEQYKKELRITPLPVGQPVM